MRGCKVKRLRTRNLPRQPLAMPAPRSRNVAVAGNDESWSLNLLEEISVVHVAESRTASQISNGICTQEDTADRSNLGILFRQRVRREEPLHCRVNDCRHSAFDYCCNSCFPIRPWYELRRGVCQHKMCNALGCVRRHPLSDRPTQRETAKSKLRNIQGIGQRKNVLAQHLNRIFTGCCIRSSVAARVVPQNLEVRKQVTYLRLPHRVVCADRVRQN